MRVDPLSIRYHRVPARVPDSYIGESANERPFDNEPVDHDDELW